MMNNILGAGLGLVLKLLFSFDWFQSSDNTAGTLKSCLLTNKSVRRGMPTLCSLWSGAVSFGLTLSFRLSRSLDLELTNFYNLCVIHAKCE